MLTRSEAVTMVVHAEIRRIGPELKRIDAAPNDGDPVKRAALGSKARFLAALYELVYRP
jgi:hypothetical protein